MEGRGTRAGIVNPSDTPEVRSDGGPRVRKGIKTVKERGGPTVPG